MGLGVRERERERVTSYFSLRGMNVPAYTFESVRTVFVELFRTPKSSMENPSLRVSGHIRSMNRTFIVEDYAEDDFAQWAKDEVIGEQGYIDDERSCFWAWDDTREMKKRKRQRTGTEWWSEEDLRGGPKERKARKACQKAMMVFRRVVFARTSPTKMQARIFPKTKAEKRIKKEKAKKEPFRNPDCQSQKHPMRESHDWSSSHWTDHSRTPDAGWFCTKAHTAWMVATPLNLANHPTHVSEFCLSNKSFVFANSEKETCTESCIIHFPTTPPCSTEVDVLETGDVPILFSLSQMKNLVRLLN